MRDIMMMILSIKKMKMKCMIDPILIMKKILKIKKLRMQEWEELWDILKPKKCVLEDQRPAKKVGISQTELRNNKLAPI